MARIIFLCFILLLVAALVDSEIGVNWGTMSHNKLSPPKVVQLLKNNQIKKVKLFDTEPDVLEALKGSGIEVMVGIPNHMLSHIASSSVAADSWVAQNLNAYLVPGGVDIKYVAVGNEPFLSTYNGQFQPYVLPALRNIQYSLITAKLVETILLVVPCNADVYQTPSVPSLGAFHPELNQTMTELVLFLDSNGSPFLVNIYLFLSLNGDPNFPKQYAFFDGTTLVVDGEHNYTNAFDGNFDTLVSVLSKIGHGDMPIVIGEVGWPTSGAVYANLVAAKQFNQGLVFHIKENNGTPLRPRFPNARSMDVYLFDLFDEDEKSLHPGEFERHWGIFYSDGQIKYRLDLGHGMLTSLVEGSRLRLKTGWIIGISISCFMFVAVMSIVVIYWSDLKIWIQVKFLL